MKAVPIREEDTQEIEEGCERLQEQFRNINIYKELTRTAAAPAAQKVAARKTPALAPPSAEITDHEEDRALLETKADVKAFCRRSDMDAVVAKMLNPAAGEGIKHDTLMWVTKRTTFVNASQHFQENAPNKSLHANPGHAKLSEGDVKSFIMQVSVALLCNHFCNSV